MLSCRCPHEAYSFLLPGSWSLWVGSAGGANSVVLSGVVQEALVLTQVVSASVVDAAEEEGAVGEGAAVV